MPLSDRDYNFITDRLAIGNVASRATPGFCAVVSLLATQPWDEVTGAPEVPNNDKPIAAIADRRTHWRPAGRAETGLRGAGRRHLSVSLGLKKNLPDILFGMK